MAETKAVTDWDRIVREHGPLVFGTAWRILGHVADTEDVVQEVFLQAYRMRAQEPIRHWAGLLHKLASCRALDRLRTRKPTVTLDDLNLASSANTPEETVIGRELAQRLREAIAQLPEREAEVFCLRFFEDLSYDQIAEILNINRGAVAQALFKARGRLQTMLTEVAHGD